MAPPVGLRITYTTTVERTLDGLLVESHHGVADDQSRTTQVVEGGIAEVGVAAGRQMGLDASRAGCGAIGCICLIRVLWLADLE